MMNNFRKSLVNRMIALYGFENPVTINFAELAEVWRGEESTLRIIVESHESCPWIEA